MRAAANVIALSVWVASATVGAWADTSPYAQSADPAGELPRSLPQDGLFSSIKQSLAQGDQDVVRGHFDLGAPPNEHRYYCLVDPKTGKQEPNGVLGEPLPRPDGMTGVKSNAVSLYRCDKAEAAGILISSGYVLLGRAAPRVPKAPAAATPVATPAPPVAAAPVTPAPAPAPPASLTNSAPLPIPVNLSVEKIDVAGVRLGMSPEDVRAVLKSKKLVDYKEWTETLSYLDTKGVSQAITNQHFVNVVAAWTAPPGAGLEANEVAGESIEVMFTPVPGKERAMSIVRTVGYTAANAIHETALENGLIKKYGGFVDSNDFPQSPTWRYQNDGSVQVGDACHRRGITGGLGTLNVANAPRENLALKKSPDEFRYQIDQCGAALVTEDHFTANSGALHQDRVVTRFTVSAFSPTLALAGAQSAGAIVQAAAHAAGKSDSEHQKTERSPDL